MISQTTAPPPLAGLRVVELATLFAGPLAATWLADFGADVVKVEHPRRPDPSRGHGPAKNGVGLWWKTIGRNKRTVTLDLSKPGGRETMLQLAEQADVVIENFRPGTLERWGLGPEQLAEANPRLIIARVTAFGQTGPYATRPGFGTVAEAMSGFAALSGEPDGAPMLPPFGLADGVAGLATAYAIMLVLASRGTTGRGQVVDLAIIEPLLALLGPQISAYDQLGYVQPRTGNQTSNNSPRNLYRTSDGSWVAVSTSAQNIAERVMRLVGREEVINEPWFATGAGRAAHRAEVDPPVAAWISAHSLPETLEAFERAEAAIGPVYDVRGILADPQYQALGTAVTVPDPELGPLRMQNLMFRLSGSPGEIRWPGRPHGEDTDAVLGELGLDTARIAELRAEGAA